MNNMTMNCIFHIPQFALVRHDVSMNHVIGEDVCNLGKDPFDGDGESIPYYTWVTYEGNALYKSEISIMPTEGLYIYLEGERYIVETVVYVPKHNILYCELTTPYEGI